jgi:hypothetical protein
MTERECKACAEGPESYEKWEKTMLEEHGWIAHYIGDDNRYPWHMNAHTHGLPDSWGHPDLQIILPIDFKIVHDIFRCAIEDKIMKGEMLVPLQQYEGIVKEFPVVLTPVTEQGRPVLRIILTREEMESSLNQQWGEYE